MGRATSISLDGERERGARLQEAAASGLAVRLVVLSFNTRELLGECLPSIVAAARASKSNARVTVLDNGSSDGSVALVRQRFPDVDVYVAPENRVLCSFNDYLRQIADRYALLLNSDVKLAPDSLDPMVQVLQAHPEAIMASPKCYRFDGSTLEGGRTRLRFLAGWFSASARYPGVERDVEVPAFTASAGAVLLVDRQKFLELGGFDDLYLPGRLEDLDLFYRAWKRGFTSYYEPRSVAYHKGFGSFHKHFGERRTQLLAFRNTWLFMWKNLTDPAFLWRALAFAPARIVAGLARGNPYYLLGFCAAAARLGGVLERRRVAAGQVQRTDAEVVALLGY